MGWLRVSQGRFESSDPVFEDTLTAALAAGDEQFSALAEVNLAEQVLDLGDVERATALLRSCAHRHGALHLRYSIAYLLDAAARVAAVRGDHARAARLLGAAAHMREVAGVSVWGSQLERRRRLVDEVHAALGDHAFAAATAEGAALRYSAAVAEAVPGPDPGTGRGSNSRTRGSGDTDG
jgi:hypothetical protein